MRVPLSWLREYVDFDLQPSALADRLTTLGLEVQGIEETGTDWHSVVVGELLDVRPHPTADRLSLTTVRVGEDSPPLDIVCGATNIRPGQRVPVALPGAVLPGGRQIGVSTIQGQESRGMLCSGDELGLTADADGILILDGAAPIGTPLDRVVGDVVLDVDVKPNRGDALSLIGLAREVAAVTGGRVRWPEITVPESGDATSDHVSVTVEEPELCPRFVARFVDGLMVGASPLAVQLRLSAAGVRPVSNIVDASNYVMLELGKPIHTFDASAVAGGHIVVRRARPGERLETLDHVVRELARETLLIADEQRALGIAGVMGGADSEVGAATTAVVIESAVFDPVSIRRTAHRYGLRSEASLRFEKGQESRLARVGADRTAQLIAQWAGGRPAVGAVDSNPTSEPPRRVAFRPDRVSRLLGEPIEPEEMRELLARAEIATEPATPEDRLVIYEGTDSRLGAEDGTALAAIVPAHRRDIAIEADVAEEVVRLRGYETIPPKLPDTRMPPYRPEPLLVVDHLRDLLSGRGLSEVVTNGLISSEQHVNLGLAANDAATIRISNPVAADHGELRRSLLPGLVRVLGTNERQRRLDVAIFEIGGIHRFVNGAPVQTEQLGILLAGNLAPTSWVEPSRPSGFEAAKGLVEWIVARVGQAAARFEATAAEPLVEHPGRTAEVVGSQRDGGSTPIGRVGELDPRYLAASGVRAERAAYAVLDIATLMELAAKDVQVPTLPQLPAMERDVAVIVPRDLAQGDVAEVIRDAAGPSLDSLSLFDRYQGPPLSSSEISLAYRLRFQPLDDAAGESALDEAIARVTRALDERLGVRVRGPEADVSA